MNFGFSNNGVDLINSYVTKSYLIDAYPNLLPSLRTASLYACGYNLYGQLGVGDAGSTSDRSSFITVSGGGSTWKQISAGIYHSVGIKSDGTLWSWGYSYLGQLGTNNTSQYSTPRTVVGTVTNWKQVSAGYQHTLVLKDDNSLWVCGYNGYGQLNTNNLTNYSSIRSTAGNYSVWNKISAGGYHSAAIKTNGELWTWGLNTSGQLGDNTSVTKSSAVQVSGGGTWSQVSCGNAHTVAIKTDGTLWTWGLNTLGQLGDNLAISRLSPVQIASGTTWSKINCGVFHTMAIKNDGTLWGTGYNLSGQLGLNNTSTSYFNSLVQVSGGGTNWKNISCGSNHTAGIKTDGSLWVWGLNSNGQLGKNNLSNYSSPVTVSGGGINWKQIACYNHTLAIADTGGL